MSEEAIYWLFWTLICVGIQAFFSMQEMAVVSINRLDLNYYLQKGSTRARWISFLLNRPDFLFTTTLIMVNTSLQIGSECSRRFYASMDLSSNWAPLSQVLLVVIVAELAPMFAARQHPRQVSFAGIPLIYLVARIMTPIVWFVGILSKSLQKMMGGQAAETDLLFSREDLKSIFMQIDHPEGEVMSADFSDFVCSNIFDLKTLKVEEIALATQTLPCLSASQTVKDAKEVFENRLESYILVYEKFPQQITGYIRPRFLMNTPLNLLLHQVSKPPFFILKNTPLLSLLSQLKESKHPIAVIIDENGNALGIFTFKQLKDFLFGLKQSSPSFDQSIVEKSFESHVKISQLKDIYHLEIEAPDHQTLSELVRSRLDHPPHTGDVVVVGQVSFFVEEASVLEPKWIRVKGRVKKESKDALAAAEPLSK